MTTLILLFVVSLILSLVLTPQVRSFALRFGLTDNPDTRRKLHKDKTPVAGGLAILLATVVSLAGMLLLFDVPMEAEFGSQSNQLIGLCAAAMIICLVGVLDDSGRLRGRHKLIGQVFAVLVVISSGLLVERIQLFHWQIELGLLAVPFTAFLLLGAVNSLNLLDGMDGLLSTVAFIITLAFAGIAVVGGKWPTACIAVAMAGGILGFLRYNFPPASIFLGDTGSMLIGLVIGSLAIQSSLKGPATAALAAPLAALAVPILDTTAAIFRRKLTGRSIYSTDRGHLHHLLLRRGYSTIGVLCCVSLFCALAVGGALLSVTLNSELVAIVSALAVVGILMGMRLFGNAELLLFTDRLKAFSASLMKLRPKETPIQSEVCLQGSGSWKEFWDNITRSALDMNLCTVRLDINAPALHEGYHARWKNRNSTASDEESVWKGEFPLLWRGQTVGRLEVTSLRDHQPLWEKVAELTKLVEDMEQALSKLAEATFKPAQDSPAESEIDHLLPAETTST